jgi:hypothetical protein
MIRSSMRWARGYRGVTCLLLLLLVPILIVACSEQKKNGPTFPAATTGVSTNGLLTLILSINPNNINKGDTTGVTVTSLTPNGAPVPDKKVNLSTTGGTLGAVFGITDAGGKFATTLRVPQDYNGPSPITVTAAVDSASTSVDVFLNSLGQLRIDPPGPLIMSPGDRQFLNCVGGVPPYRWEPSGGTLNRTNEPSVIFTAGSAVGTFFVKCSDAAGNSASVQITISLTVGGLTVTPSSASLRPGQSLTFQASGGRPGFTWSFPPAAGTLSTTTGPTTILTAGNADGVFTLTLKDSTGATATASVTIRVETLTLSPTSVDVTRQAPGTTPPGTCGTVTFQVNFVIAGGTGPFTATSAFFGSIPVGGSTFIYNFSQTMDGGASLKDVVTVRDSRGFAVTADVNVTCKPAVAPTP